MAKLPKYDAAFIACREPNPTTGKFDEHHTRTLHRAARLQQSGVVRLIVVSGRYAKWYDEHGLTPWFGTEADASKNELIFTHGRPAQSILKDPNAKNSVANFICSAEDIFDNPENNINSIVVLTAKGRLARQRFIARKVLEGVVRMDFRSTGPTNDPGLDTNERFALAMQRRFLNVPNGRAGWDELKATNYEGAVLRPFWLSFDAAKQALLSAQEGITPNLLEIVSNMDTVDVSPMAPGIMDFASTAARQLISPRAAN